MSYCQACGNALSPGVKFCSKCGAVVGAATPAQPSEKKSGGCLKIFLIFLFILALVIAVFGYLGYWGYHKISGKIQQKWEQTKSEIQKSEATPKTSAGEVKTEEPCPDSNLSSLSLDKGIIPMRPGLTMAKTWSTTSGDEETLTQVQSLDNKVIFATASSSKTTGKRNICVEDLRDGNVYVTTWGANSAETIRGATMFSLSKKQFEELKSNGEIPFTYYVSTERTGDHSYVIKAKNIGTIRRDEPDDVPFDVIVNDQRVKIPTIHAKGNLSGVDTELYVVDDLNNPIVLHFRQPQKNFQLKILKISYPEEKKIEKQLAEEGKVQVYGIYFDFNEDTIRPESEPVLKEIADALNAHSDWNLAVNGHTDNIGGAAYNMDLSNRRAASVKKALVERYNIAADRLTTAGFGMSQPIETNETPEGRARNRRVELIKQ